MHFNRSVTALIKMTG